MPEEDEDQTQEQIRDYYHEERGWRLCRLAVMNIAIRHFSAGRDNEVILLRDIVNKDLVIQEDSLGVKLPSRRI